jgi:hypothetical protein
MQNENDRSGVPPVDALLERPFVRKQSFDGNF